MLGFRANPTGPLRSKMSSEENENPEPLAGAFGVKDGHLRSHPSNLANGGFESKGSAPRFPVAVVLRAILPDLMRRGFDPWHIAQMAAMHAGKPNSELDAAQALRWYIAHAMRHMGQRGAALILARELLIDCDRLRAQEKALCEAENLPEISWEVVPL